MKKFIKIDKYGDLYVDRILFESHFPIIFTCRDTNNNIFISVCCQNNGIGCKWLVGKTDESSIIKMLRDEITIRDLLLNFSSGKISVDYIDGNYTITYGNSDWNDDSIYLPKKDSYMYAEEGEFDDDIAYFSVNDHINYDKENYIDIEVSETIYEETESIADIENSFNVSREPMVILWEINEVIPNNLTTNADNCIHKKKYEIKFCSNFEALPNDPTIQIKIDDRITNAA